MLPTIIEEYFSTLNEIESKQKASGQFIFNYPNASILNNKQQMIFSQDYFLGNQQIYMNKHNRFAAYPLHTHEFLEFNYMLKGSCQQIVNQQPITLKEGELLLLDRGSQHEIAQLNQEDWLINIIFYSENVNLDWLSTLSKKNSFVLDFFLAQNEVKENGQFLLFHSQENQHVQEILSRMIQIYYLSQELADQMIKLYIPILITELIANVSFQMPKMVSPDQQLLLSILQMIEDDYQQVTLQKLAHDLGYHPNYLSSKIKQLTNKNFGQLLNEVRLRQACFLLENTNDTIENITQKIGLQNRTRFYQLFKETYQTTPKNWRKEKGLHFS